MLAVAFTVMPWIQVALLKDFGADTYSRIATQKELPSELRSSLAKVIPYPLAESAERFNASDVVTAGRINRLFLVAFASRSRGLLAYEHGGGANDQHVLGFTIDDAGKLTVAFHMTLEPGERVTSEDMNRPDRELVGRLLAGQRRWIADHY